MSDELITYQPKFQTGYTICDNAYSDGNTNGTEIVIGTYPILMSLQGNIPVSYEYSGYDTYHTIYAVYSIYQDSCYWRWETDAYLVCSNPSRGKKSLNIPRVQQKIIRVRSIPEYKVEEFIKMLKD